jgi:hypothetical protein
MEMPLLPGPLASLELITGLFHAKTLSRKEDNYRVGIGLLGRRRSL